MSANVPGQSGSQTIFLSEGGKLWPPVQGVAREVGPLDNLRTITAGIRKAGIQIFIVPHHRWEPGDYQTWDHPNPYQLQLVRQRQLGR